MTQATEADDSTDPNDYDIELGRETRVAGARDSTNNISYGLHQLKYGLDDVYALTSAVNTPDGASVSIQDIGHLSFEAAEVDLDSVNEAVTDAGLEPLTDEQLQAVQDCYDESVEYCLWEALADVRRGEEAFHVIKGRAYYEDMAYPEGWDSLDYYANVTPEQIDVITQEISDQMGHGWVQYAVHAEYEADIVIDSLNQDQLAELAQEQEN